MQIKKKLTGKGSRENELKYAFARRDITTNTFVQDSRYSGRYSNQLLLV
jgi:hypothetical protein